MFDAVLLIGLLIQRRVAMGVWKIHGSFRHFVFAMAGFLFAAGVASSIVGLPFACYAQFKLEDRFGFNTTTVKTWVLDRLKGFLLAVLLGYPLLVLVLKLIEWTGAKLVALGSGSCVAFQLLLLLIAPAIIMPLFNKFTPLPEGACANASLRWRGGPIFPPAVSR